MRLEIHLAADQCATPTMTAACHTAPETPSGIDYGALAAAVTGKGWKTLIDVSRFNEAPRVVADALVS